MCKKYIVKSSKVLYKKKLQLLIKEIWKNDHWFEHFFDVYQNTTLV